MLTARKRPWWWRLLWAVTLGYCSVVEFQHLRSNMGKHHYHNVPGPLIMGIGLLYMTSEAAQGTWP